MTTINKVLRKDIWTSNGPCLVREELVKEESLSGWNPSPHPFDLLRDGWTNADFMYFDNDPHVGGSGFLKVGDEIPRGWVPVTYFECLRGHKATGEDISDGTGIRVIRIPENHRAIIQRIECGRVTLLIAPVPANG